MAVDVVRRQRLLKPADIDCLVESRAPDRLVDGKGLIGVGEDFEVDPNGRSELGQACDVLLRRSADLDLRAAEALYLGLSASATSASVGRWSQPPSVV